MVRRIKPKPRKSPKWLVPFDAEHFAGIFLHDHGESDDHSRCGPVIMDSQRAADLFKIARPDDVEKIHTYDTQRAEFLCSWFDRGLPVMNFALCDEKETLYLVQLPAEEARALLRGRVEPRQYHRPEFVVS